MTAMLNALYKPNLSLLTDQYELAMAYGYWRDGRAEDPAVFNLFFRSHAFDGGYTLAAGLEQACEFLEGFRFEEEDLEYLSSMRDSRDERLFESDFLRALGEMEFACDVDAVPEGTPVFPNQPMLRVSGPVWQAQILESPLLNALNFPSLIATKAARMVRESGGKPIIDFGLRRSQGIDGSVTAARSAYLGGIDSTSNVLAGKLLGLPVKGTHAHSWITFYGDEEEAFEAFARAMPGNTVFLVDTYDTLEGVRNAIKTADRLQRDGIGMMGVRLDSGDLAELSVEARKLLDEAGYEDAKIVASDRVNEYAIRDHNRKGSKIDLYGVGTHLVTGGDDASLGCVYKFGGRGVDGDWRYELKLSEEPEKINHPGFHQIRRFERDGETCGDMLYDAKGGEPGGDMVLENGGSWSAEEDMTHRDLLRPVFREGKRVMDLPGLEAIRDHVRSELDKLPEKVRDIENPELYPVGLESGFHQTKQRLVESKKREVELS